jgi:hypothetical protein
MAKKMHSRELAGYTKNGKFALSYKEVSFFHTKDTAILVFPDTADTVFISTSKSGKNLLKRHLTNNYFYGTLNGIKVQVSLKKLVGTVRWWA